MKYMATCSAFVAGYGYYGEFPLSIAAVFNHMDIYDFLIKTGANTDLQDVYGNTVLHLIVLYKQKVKQPCSVGTNPTVLGPCPVNRVFICLFLSLKQTGHRPMIGYDLRHYSFRKRIFAETGFP